LIIKKGRIHMDDKTVKKDHEKTQAPRFSSFFGSIMKRLRGYAGMSQATLSVETGIDQSHLCTLETKTVDFSVNTMQTICSGIKTSPAAATWFMEQVHARQALTCTPYEVWHCKDQLKKSGEPPYRIADQDQP